MSLRRADVRISQSQRTSPRQQTPDLLGSDEEETDQPGEHDQDTSESTIQTKDTRQKRGRPRRVTPTVEEVVALSPPRRAQKLKRSFDIASLTVTPGGELNSQSFTATEAGSSAPKKQRRALSPLVADGQSGIAGSSSAAQADCKTGSRIQGNYASAIYDVIVCLKKNGPGEVSDFEICIEERLLTTRRSP